MSNNDSMSNTISKVDNIINSYYKQSFIDTFLNCTLIKDLINTEFFKKLNNWYINNFVIINKILGILGVVGGIGLVLSTLQYLLYFGNGIYGILYFVLYVILAFLSFLSGVGFLLNKKWLPFITLLYCGYSIFTFIFVEILNIIFLSFYTFYVVSISSIFISVIIALIISIILCSLILGNKEKFTK